MILQIAALLAGNSQSIMNSLSQPIAKDNATRVRKYSTTGVWGPRQRHYQENMIFEIARKTQNFTMPPDFESKEYWHDRFLHETSFEWLIQSRQFISILEPFLARLPSDAKILHLGCGTSDLHNFLRQRGFTSVINLDYEPLAIERSRQKERDLFGDVRMSYVVADATELDPNEMRSALVIDKGTADAIACSGDEAVISLVKAVQNCLKEDGMWISLSYSSLRYDLEQIPLGVEVISKVLTPKRKETDPDIFYYCYLLQESKGEPDSVQKSDGLAKK